MRNRASAAEFMRADSLTMGVQPDSHGHRRHCRAGDQRFARGYFERLIRRQDDGRRTHSLVRWVDAGWRHTFIGESLHGQNHPDTRHDDAIVGRYQPLLSSIDNRSHALLNRGILHGKTPDAAEGSAGLLGAAIYQVVVLFVGEWPIAAGLVF